MAFNPFHGFRKYRKTMFAVLTIICMFVFILSSGLGGGADLLNRRFFGGSKYPEVANLDGRRIDTEELKQAYARRELANKFMSLAVSRSQELVIRDLQSRMESVPATIRPQIQEAMSKRFIGQFGGREYFLDYFRSIPRYVRMVDAGIGILERDKKNAEADLLKKFKRVMIQDQGRRDYFGEQYFGGTLRGQDLIDFMVWKWAADKRDIQLSTEAVQRLWRDEVGEDADSAATAVEEFMKNQSANKKMPVTMLLDSLADEFRVRLVKAALLGETTKNPATIGAYVTPHEFYKHYRDIRTSIRTNLLPVTVDSFLDKVTEKPTDDQLKELFKKHRNEEWTPDKEQPGFKEGKKVKIEWVAMKAEPPLIKKAALEDSAKQTALAEGVAKTTLRFPPGDNFAGVLGRIGALAIVEDPKLMDKRTDAEYATYSAMEKGKNWTYPALFAFSVHDRSLYQPRVIATAVADILGSKGTGGFPLSPAISIVEHAGFQEMRERIRFGMLPFALGGQSIIQMLSISDMMLPQPLPKEALQSRLKEEVTAAVVKDFLIAETQKFEKTFADEAKDIKKPETRQKLDKYADEFVKKYGLTKGMSKEFRDRYALIDDPGLKPLKDKYMKESSSTDPKGVRFGDSYFESDPRTGAENPVLHPQWFLHQVPFRASTNPDEEFYLTWKNEDLDAKLRTFDEARSDVEKAWRRIKARELASKAAEDLQKQVRDKAIKNLATLKDFTAQAKIEPIEIGPMALRNELAFGGGTMYDIPRVPQDKVNFPPEDLGLKLMELRDKPLGDTMIVFDKPKGIFYVAVLTERTEPTETEFQMVYARSGPDAMPRSDPLLNEFEMEQRAKARVDILKQLRADAKVATVDEQLKSFSERRGGGIDE